MIVAIRIANRFGEPLMALAEESRPYRQPQPRSAGQHHGPLARGGAVGQCPGGHAPASACRPSGVLQAANSELEAKVAKRTVALRQNQEILQKREAFFRAIFDNAAVGIVSLDAGQNPVLVNPAFARFVDQPIDQLLRQPESIALPAEVIDRMRARAQQQ